MKILFSPQGRYNEQISYHFEDDIIFVTQTQGDKVYSDIFDFTQFGDGVLEMHDFDGNDLLETTLLENPIMKAHRTSGELYVELLKIIDPHGPEEERFPDWINHTDYITPEIGVNKDFEEASKEGEKGSISNGEVSMEDAGAVVTGEA